MTDRSRRPSSEVPPQAPSPSRRQGVSPALSQSSGGGAGLSIGAMEAPPRPQQPDRQRLSSNSQLRSPGVGQLSASPDQVSPGRQQQNPHQHHPEDREQPLPPPPFAPVFALIDDETTRTTHHPQVHYIFSDDDPEILTAALAEVASHQPSPPESIWPVMPTDVKETGEAGGEGVSTGATQPSSQQQATGGRPPTRAILLDLVPDPEGGRPGFVVASAASLNSEWAITGVRLSSMEIDDGRRGGNNNHNPNAAGGGEGGRLMLRIGGVGLDDPNPITPPHARLGPDAAGPSGAEEWAALSEDFGRRMDTLRRVMAYTTPAEQRVLSGSDIGGGDLPPPAADITPTPAEQAEGSPQRRDPEDKES